MELSPALDRQLKSVSRSFYLSLIVVPKPLRPAVGVGYLLCKTADTIADTPAVPDENRLEMLNRLRRLFAAFPMSEEACSKLAEDLSDLNASPQSSEGRLLNQATRSFQAFRALSRTDQSLIQHVVLSVMQGMEMDLETFGQSLETLTALKTRKELDAYIRLIGGEPGRFWTKLSLHHLPELKISDRDAWLRDGVEFGKGLQMINILRDFSSDLHQGRCYIPLDLLLEHELTVEDLQNGGKTARFLTLYHGLIDETLVLLSHGVRYIQAIPPSYWRLRAAVWWPLAIGLESLARLRLEEDVLNPARTRKIKRSEVYRLMAKSLVLLWSDRWVGKEFDRLALQASSASGI